jgi:hypothetical protein
LDAGNEIWTPFGISGSKKRKFEKPLPLKKESLRSCGEGSTALENTSGGRGNQPAQLIFAKFESADRKSDLLKGSIPNALHARENRNQERQETNSAKQHDRIKRAVRFLL